MSNQEPDGWMYFDTRDGLGWMFSTISHFERAKILNIEDGIEQRAFNLISPQELSRLRKIAEWAKDQRTRFLSNLEDLFLIRGQRDEALTTRIAIESYDAITAPVEAKPEPKMHTDAFGQPLIGRAKQ